MYGQINEAVAFSLLTDAWDMAHLVANDLEALMTIAILMQEHRGTRTRDEVLQVSLTRDRGMSFSVRSTYVAETRGEE